MVGIDMRMPQEDQAGGFGSSLPLHTTKAISSKQHKVVTYKHLDLKSQ
jgi:hypothetical protein